MKVILVSDIFGVTPAFNALAQQLGVSTIFDPYCGQEMAFSDEQCAYKHFSQSVGLERYSERLIALLAQQTRSVTVIGFSVGASALWCASKTVSNSNIVKGIGYYGSQIRNNLAIHPTFPIELVFPRVEEHFDVDRVIAALAYKSHVTCSKVPHLHGFMNKSSTNFDALAYQQELNKLKLLTPPSAN